MIISKFVTLKAFIDSNPGMAILLADGSAATVFFWTKWMGKIMSIKDGETRIVEHPVSRWEQFTLAILAIATVVVCLAFPFISFRIIDPYLQEMFGKIPMVDTFNVLVIFVIMIGLLIILPLGLFYYPYVNKIYKRVGTYLGGANIDNVSFEGAMDHKHTADFKNYYLTKYFVEGEATGQPSTMELSAGPRVVFRSSGRIVPYAELRASLFWARVRMSEALGELGGEETKSVRGDLAVSVALGADVRVTDRISVGAKAGIMPARGGTGAMASIGALYGF